VCVGVCVCVCVGVGVGVCVCVCGCVCVFLGVCLCGVCVGRVGVCFFVYTFIYQHVPLLLSNIICIVLNFTYYDLSCLYTF